MKQLLREVLGHACLTYEELHTTLCDCEAVINMRPLTYVSDDLSDLAALTPAMFLQEKVDHRVPDCDIANRMAFCRTFKYLQKRREDLRRRFRNE